MIGNSDNGIDDDSDDDDIADDIDDHDDITCFQRIEQ
jgi:hypothetical protein